MAQYSVEGPAVRGGSQAGKLGSLEPPAVRPEGVHVWNPFLGDSSLTDGEGAGCLSPILTHGLTRGRVVTSVCPASSCSTPGRARPGLGVVSSRLVRPNTQLGTGSLRGFRSPVMPTDTGWAVVGSVSRPEAPLAAQRLTGGQGEQAQPLRFHFPMSFPPSPAAPAPSSLGHAYNASLLIQPPSLVCGSFSPPHPPHPLTGAGWPPGGQGLHTPDHGTHALWP